MTQLSGVATWTPQALWGTALSQNFPDITLRLIHADLNYMYDSGTIPIIHPMFKPETTENRQIVQDIRNGVYNTAIDNWLRDLKTYTDTGRKCIVGPYPEMNGIWVNYGPDRNNFDPTAAVDIYRYFVTRGRLLGLTSDKVLWCWAPNDIGWGPLAPYWPGDAFVDIVGGSAYNWGGLHAGEPWETPAQVIDPYVADIRKLTNKPIIVTQTGAGEGDSRTPGWLNQLVEYTKGDKIEGFVWFSISEFTYQPGPANFKTRIATLDNDRPDYWFQEDTMPTKPLTSKQTRAAWSEYLCNIKDWFTIEVLNRAPVKTIRKLAEAWSAFERVMYAFGYGNAGNVSSYMCRWPSLHSFRLANDVDPTLNARQGEGATMNWGKCKLTRTQSDAVERIRTNSGAQVFRNGHVFWNPDPMHFQISCTQADIESGINWSTVEGDGVIPAPPPEYEDDDMYCKYGDGSVANPNENVLHWQVKLVALGQDVGSRGPDGDYGNKTKGAVLATVPASDGMQIGGIESGVIDVTLGKLGPMIPGGVEHQHDEYALQVHAHVVTGQAK